MICDRCKKETRIHTMSYFNTDILCDVCHEKERAHPDYRRAVERENEAVKAGEYNFPGIGKPEDL